MDGRLRNSEYERDSKRKTGELLVGERRSFRAENVLKKRDGVIFELLCNVRWVIPLRWGEHIKRGREECRVDNDEVRKFPYAFLIKFIVIWLETLKSSQFRTHRTFR